MRKFAVAAAAVAMPIGMLAATGGVAFAGHGGSSKVDVSKDSISCTVAATAGLAPHITSTSIPSKVNSTIHVTLSACTVSGPVALPAGTTVTGSGTGVLHVTTTGATGVPTPAMATTGKITINWTATAADLSTVKLAAPQSKLSIGTVSVSTNGALPTSNATLSVGSTSVKGDFAGADNGATSSLTGTTTQTLSDIQTALSGAGLSSVGFGGPISLG